MRVDAADPLAIYNDGAQTRILWDLAKALSTASITIPDSFRGKPGDIFSVLLQAKSLGVDPMFAIGSSYVARGKVGFSAAFWIALCNRIGVFEGPILWETAGEGSSMSVTAKARLKRGNVDVSQTLSYKQCSENGWTKDKQGNVKDTWRGMTELMLRWRTATWLIRQYAPEVMQGMVYSAEEMQDTDAGQSVSGQSADLNKMLE